MIDEADVPPGGVLGVGLVGQLVPRHGRQQPEELVGGVQFILAERGADEEAGHDRLADVHRVEHPAEPRVDQADPGRPADHRLVPADQLGRRPLVPARTRAIRDWNASVSDIATALPPAPAVPGNGQIVPALKSSRDRGRDLRPYPTKRRRPGWHRWHPGASDPALQSAGPLPPAAAVPTPAARVARAPAAAVREPAGAGVAAAGLSPHRAVAFRRVVPAVREATPATAGVAAAGLAPHRAVTPRGAVRRVGVTPRNGQNCTLRPSTREAVTECHWVSTDGTFPETVLGVSR